MSDKVLRNFRDGKLSIGTPVHGGPLLVEVLGSAGFDFVILNMDGPLDWEEVANSVRAAKAYDMTVLVWVPSHTIATPNGDPHTAVDAARALRCGADGVLLTPSTPADFELPQLISKVWTRRSWTLWYDEYMDRFEEMTEKLARDTLVMLTFSGGDAIKHMDKIRDISGVGGIFLATSRISTSKGHAFDYEHPEVLSTIDRAASICQQKGIPLGANIGYQAMRDADPEKIVKAVQGRYEHGVRMVAVQQCQALLYYFSKRIIKGIREQMP